MMAFHASLGYEARRFQRVGPRAAQMSDFRAYCLTAAKNFEALSELEGVVQTAIASVGDALRRGNKIIFCGNGGSAADAQHLAAELVGRYLMEREPLPALALTVDTSALTAIANDYSFDEVFARQLRGLGQQGDVLVAISTSGNSKNVLRAIEVARDKGIVTIGLTGQSGGQMRQLCDICVCVPSDRTNHIQEMHIAIGHAICGQVEAQFAARV
ncbi:D-sedoheptulose 7-phosphate isomerase [Pseudorhodoplanes sp.]|uniref:D-sedoheptulose 7-phosphate isomerase n=1 Tax=Pseudorhodoplanes sp. TaxID=1934341 RepID=UPI002C198CE6|nr:D-sedoheptulose 7-phosphate isomerase [Pseudorhodoplanes sp.]HWV55138.1 D-sedoheptulose 7-phosphate isomerase [Pseudorhodoplanes sp.]